MSANTPDQQITYPVGGDLADNPNAFLDMLADVEQRLARLYTNLADRAARQLVIAENEISGLASENRIDAYDGANNISLAARGHYAMKVRTSDAAAINASTVLVNDATLTTPIDATGTYRFRGVVFYDSSTTADFKLAFTFPATTNGRWGMQAHNATTTTSFDALVTSVSGTALAAGGLGTGTANTTFVMYEGTLTFSATGTLQMQYAQNTSDATNTVVRAASSLEVMRVA